MDKRLIQSASKRLELLDITLVSESLSTDQDSYSFGMMKCDPTTQQTRCNSEVSIGEYDFDDSHLTTIIVIVNLATRLVQSKDDENDTDDHVYAEISAAIRVEYGLMGSMPSEQAIREFANYNAVHNAYPFWREIVFSLANRAKLPSVFVPLFRDAVSGHKTEQVAQVGSGIVKPKKRRRPQKKLSVS